MQAAITGASSSIRSLHHLHGALDRGKLRCAGSATLRVNDAVPHPNYRRVRPVAGAQLRQNVLDLAFHRLFGDGKLRGDFFVGQPVGDQTEDTGFGRRERLFSRVLRHRQS